MQNNSQERQERSPRSQSYARHAHQLPLWGTHHRVTTSLTTHTHIDPTHCLPKFCVKIISFSPHYLIYLPEDELLLCCQHIFVHWGAVCQQTQCSKHSQQVSSNPLTFELTEWEFRQSLEFSEENSEIEPWCLLENSQWYKPSVCNLTWLCCHPASPVRYPCEGKAL